MEAASSLSVVLAVVYHDIYVLHELVDVGPMAVLPRLLDLLEQRSCLLHVLTLDVPQYSREDGLHRVKQKPRSANRAQMRIPFRGVELKLFAIREARVQSCT
jgi:hypothetical protein